MSDVKDYFQTTSGDGWYKAEDTVGRTYYVKEGEGRKSREAYAAAKSHTPEAAVGQRGEDVESALADVDLYQGNQSVPTMGLSRGTISRVKGGRRNKWLGYLNEVAGPDPSDEERAEAFRDFALMVEQLEAADTAAEREEIKEQFGVGDS